jgi:hypothetical protein
VDSEHLHEFTGVREAACEGLRSGAFVPDAGSPVCRFVILPSFGNSVAWEVRSRPVRARPAELRLFRSCWRMDLDLQHFGSPLERLKHPRPYRPTVEVGSVLVDADRINALVHRFGCTPIPLGVAVPPVGCDGTIYELDIGNFFCHARIAWWVSLPLEWKALEPIIEDMVALFELAWQTTNPAP